MGKMKWRYLKKYYGRLNLRWELLRPFRYTCKQLRLTQQECFLMLLLLFAEVGRWLSPDDIKKVASDVYKSLLSLGKVGTHASTTTNTSIPLNINGIILYEDVDEELEESWSNKARTRKEGQEVSEEALEEATGQRVGFSNEVVEDWLGKLRLILSKLLEEFYMLYKENEKLRKKNKELKKTLDEIMDYIISHDPALYVKIRKAVEKEEGYSNVFTTRKISV